jgi:translation initiation factor IF-3
VVDEEGNQLGIMPPFEALKTARNAGLDLVEVAPAANPPVCRIINYGKYLYQLNKRQHEARKHQKSVGLKEVKFRPRTSEHDYEVKRNRIVGFLEDGSKVKATVMFRGREMAHREIGRKMMNRLFEEIGEVGQVETMPRQEGPTLTAILAPKKVTAKPGSKPSAGAARKAGTAAGSKHAPRPSAGGATVAPGSPEPSGG